VHTCNPKHSGSRGKFKASLGCIMRSCLKKNPDIKKEKEKEERESEPPRFL
jgi:hypothetical protein